MVYRDTLSALVRCLAADAIDSTAKQAWQKLYTAGYQVERGGQGLPAEVMRDIDCWLHARLHSQLRPLLWNVLVAKYSTHKGRKVQALAAVIPFVPSPAGRLFVQYAVTTWAIPKLKGVEGKRSTDMLVLPDSYYDMNRWEGEGRPEQTRNRWRRDIRNWLEGQVTEAVNQAHEVMAAEGLLIDNAAA